VSIALIATLLVAFIGQGTDERGDFLLSHTDQRYAHRLPQSLFHQLFKCFLTSYKGFDIVVRMSHWYPPGNLCSELYASSGYQTLIFHTIQFKSWLEDEEEPMAIDYTSGTTGNPKGAVYSHRGAYLGAIAQVIELGLSSSSVFLWTLPMFHCNGWCYTWAVTVVGGTHICLRPLCHLRMA
jgi:acyl-CoA synthetase (AMP-forming)/AMP-acid ligase II